MHVVSTFWLVSDTSGTFSLHFAQQSYELERPAFKMHLLQCRTHICSCKLSAKVSLMLGNPFPVPSLCKLNHISVFFIQISTNITTNSLFLSWKAMFFWGDPQCFGLLGKFQHNIEISIKVACVSRLSFCFLWLWWSHFQPCFVYSKYKPFNKDLLKISGMTKLEQNSQK